MFVPRAVRQRPPTPSRIVITPSSSALSHQGPQQPLGTTALDPPLSVVSTSATVPTSVSRVSPSLVSSVAVGPVTVDWSSCGGEVLRSATVLHGGDNLSTDLCRRSEDEDDPVKLRSIDQRDAALGEPSCVVCGRYGEYICDETDDDVCSMECKAVVLKRVHDSSPRASESCTISVPDAGQPTRNAHGLRQQNPKSVVYSRDLLPSMQDESEVVVRDGEKNLPEWEPDMVIQKLTPEQVDALRKQTEISVQGDEVPRPILEFSNCKLLPKLQTNLEIAGYELPTPVQMQVIPAALKGRDVLVSAATGSGKTVGYLLSIVFRSCLIRSCYGLETRKPLAIVLTPTRELCIQVEEQAKALAKGLPFKTALVVGGDAMPQQIYRINQGVELIVGTPGRLIDLLGRHDIELDDVCILVLDEVDCMLERGFRDQVMEVQTALTQPQILMFSATIPPAIEKFSTSILRRPLLISVGKSSLPNEAVKQTVIWVESNHKKKKLFQILSSTRHFRPPVVVFVNSRLGAELLAESIKSETGLQAVALHGEKPMQERREVLKAFLVGSVPVVVATGVLSRGLDLIRVSQVIVFDMPHTTQEYIHQIGRASRLGVPGSAMVFINDESKLLFKDFIELLQRAGVVVPVELTNSPYAVSSYAAVYNPRKRKVHHKPKRG